MFYRSINWVDIFLNTVSHTINLQQRDKEQKSCFYSNEFQTGNELICRLRHRLWCAILSYFVYWSTKLPLNWRKPENNTLQRWKNTKEIIINHKEPRMVKDGEDSHGLKTTKLKISAKLFKPFNREVASLNQNFTSTSTCKKINQSLLQC